MIGPSFNNSSGSNPSDAYFKNYGSVATKQGEDYTDIMNRFRGFYDQASSNANKGPEITIPGYTSTPDYKDAISNLGVLSKTGGYSPEDIANIRARAVSPIRSVYGNAQRNLNRQRSLQGGYSPNYTAATTKMARDQAGQLSDATTNINAQIGQSVASNKLAAATPYASIAAGEQANQNQFNQRNADTQNEYGYRNFAMPLQMRLSALQGMTGLYGTTPGATALAQKGAFDFSELQNLINQQNKNYDINLLGRYS